MTCHVFAIHRLATHAVENGERTMSQMIGEVGATYRFAHDGECDGCGCRCGGHGGGAAVMVAGYVML